MLRSLMALLLLAACVPLARAGLPETPQPRQLSVFDGLPSNRINGLAEDLHGYLWIATSDGLARYDGIGYRVWRGEDGLGDSLVWSVHVDGRNRVWIGTSKAGLAVLSADRQSFRHYTQANTPGMASGEVWTVASTRNGDVWFGMDGGGLHRLGADGKLTRFMPRDGDARSLPDGRVTHLEVAPDGSLWVATRNGTARWTGHDFERLPASAEGANGLTFEADGTLWLSSLDGVQQRTPQGRLVPAPWRDEPAVGRVYHVLCKDRDKDYWLDVTQGLGRSSGEGVRNVPLYSAAARGVVKPSWNMCLEDRGGGLWFASSGYGLWYLPASWKQFSVLSRRAGDATSPGNAFVRGIAASANGSMWLVGSGGALDRLDPETGAIEHVLSDAGAGDVPVGVHEDRNGMVWIGYRDGIARFDPGSGAVRRWSSAMSPDPAPVGETASFAESGDGLLWMASPLRVQARNLAGEIQYSVPAGNDDDGAEGALAPQLEQAPDGGIWLSGWKGLFAWNAGARSFEPVPGVAAEPVYGFWIGRDRKQVWLARMGAVEAYQWDGARLHLRERVDARQGMPRISLSGITVDAAGIAWATSVRGLLRVDTSARTVRVYGVHDGLPSQELLDRPVPRPADGRILIGSADGLVVFDPAVVRPRAKAPNLVIETIAARRGDKLVEFAADRPFTIEHGDRDLRIVARLLSFGNAMAHRYRFRLHGYDNDWVEVGAGGERLFSQLPAGNYVLQVKARNADNVWSPTRELKFSVAPAWWRTWWAMLALTLMLALLAWRITYNYRMRLRRRSAWQLAVHKREVAEQASLAKTRFLATLGHEVRTPMTGVLGMSELLLGSGLAPQQRGYAESIRNAGEHLMRLVNDALDLARIESGKLELAPQDFDLHALLHGVCALTAPLAGQRGLRFDESIAADVPQWVHGDPVRVRQILLNLLGNALKFTEHGEIGLQAAKAGQSVRMVVSDTGPGLDAGQQERLFRRFEQAEGARTAARYGGSGLGLAISQELAAAMGGRISVDSEPGHGTRFIVELPLAPAQSPMQVASEPSTGTTAGASFDLLLVEDDPTVAEVVSALLQAQGHRVTHAAHGLAALSQVSVDDFDMALLDLDLPGIDGFALAQQLRAQGFAKPLLAITARADADAEPAARAAGFDGFLRKPLTGKLLAEAIDALLPRAPATEAS